MGDRCRAAQLTCERLQHLLGKGDSIGMPLLGAAAHFDRRALAKRHHEMEREVAGGRERSSLVRRFTGRCTVVDSDDDLVRALFLTWWDEVAVGGPRR